MFGVTFFRDPDKRRIGESCRGFDTYHMVKVVKRREDDSCDDVTFELQKRNTSVAFTPQSGINTQLYDLSFMFRTNMDVQHSPILVSAVDSRNPISSAKFVESVSTDLKKSKK